MGFASKDNRGLKATGEVGQAKALFKACCGIGKLVGGENHGRMEQSRPARKRKQR
jgi:hypothetical protein